MSDTLIRLADADRSHLPLVGGKAANLGELSRLEGIRVPPGFCVTTRAYRRILAAVPAAASLLGRLDALDAGDAQSIRTLSAELRGAVGQVAIPDDVAREVIGALALLGTSTPCAVRSSATAEDLPDASFAGQQDSYLNLVGPEQVLAHISRCWASLFTERAVAYRLRNRIAHHAVSMAVVVQRMVEPRVSGVLFTADPVSGHRRVTVVEAVEGLGEALVSGRVTPDIYRVQDGRVFERTVAARAVRADAVPGGGTRERARSPHGASRAALTDDEVIRLAGLGALIQAHLGAPQDVEWCLDDEGFHIVQSRPITTLFPIPERSDDEKHVYLSVGHQQMMTDPMKPLGISFFQHTAGRPMFEAGGRLFVDVTATLSSAAGRDPLLEMMGRSDPLLRDALETLIARGDFIPPLAEPGVAPGSRPAPRSPAQVDPGVVPELVERTLRSLADLERRIEGVAGPQLVDLIIDDIAELRSLLTDPVSFQAIMAGMEAAWWLNDHLRDWLGEQNAADTLTLSVSGNVTSEMGLALMEVADVIRRHPQVVAFLETAEDDFLGRLGTLAGGAAARDAIDGFLARYGMRGVGEIDITRPRWSEQPAALLPVILGNVRKFQPGAAATRFARGLGEAREREREVLERLRALPDGEARARQTGEMIARVRAFAGYREFPKYGMVSRYFIYKRALTAEGDRLVARGLVRRAEDIFYLTLEELRAVAAGQTVDARLLEHRREAFVRFAGLVPPRVLTSDGEAISGAYRREGLPEGALVGLGVSSGVVEGRARIAVTLAEAALEPGDILVTTYTDPSWTPLFVGISGLVTEVGGMMTHGAVIAREYGLPAVVGVEGATRRIRDGQRIRLHGTEGCVELLDDGARRD